MEMTSLLVGIGSFITGSIIMSYVVGLNINRVKKCMGSKQDNPSCKDCPFTTHCVELTSARNKVPTVNSEQLRQWLGRFKAQMN